eukprot:3007493-Amphidinium_carterae.1
MKWQPTAQEVNAAAQNGIQGTGARRILNRPMIDWFGINLRMLVMKIVINIEIWLKRALTSTDALIRIFSIMQLHFPCGSEFCNHFYSNSGTWRRGEMARPWANQVCHHVHLLSLHASQARHLLSRSGPGGTMHGPPTSSLTRSASVISVDTVVTEINTMVKYNHNNVFAIMHSL